MPATASVPVIVPAPSDQEITQFVHKISGITVNSRPVAFAIAGDSVEPIFWPKLDPKQWAEIVRLPSGYYSAWGLEALSVQQLASAVKRGGKFQ